MLKALGFNSLKVHPFKPLVSNVNLPSPYVEVPMPLVWELWQDKTRIPNWMPWLGAARVGISLTPR